MYDRMNTFKVKKSVKIFFLLIFLVSVIFVFKTSSSMAQTQSRDAIAVRILNNVNHYSPMRWYEEQGFTGAPEKIKVDGYEAVRDGRTVYVAASNVADGNLYTNIYLISYNNLADNNTINIFEKLLSNWKFNSNLMEIAGVGECVDLATIAPTGRSCYVNEDCTYPNYCSSDKAKVVRDTKRHADLTDLVEMIENYRDSNGGYPTMSSGSYLKNRTLSTWPSWKSHFSHEVGIGNPDNMPVDPFNKIGDCGDNRFDAITCWDEVAQEYAGGNVFDSFNLPATCSRVYLYRGNDNGLSYKLCANFDSNYNLYPAVSDYENCNNFDASHDNTAPIFTSQEQLLNAHVGENYIAYVSAYDADGDALDWSVSGVASAQVSQTVSSYHKRIAIPGGSFSSSGPQTINVVITDGVNTTNKNFIINVFN